MRRDALDRSGRRLAALFARWRRDRRGAVAISFAMTALGMMAALVFAVDMGRIHVTGVRLQTALDAAALAGTRDLRSATFATDVRQVFDANFDADGIGAEVLDFTLTPIEDDFGVRRLELAAEARLASPLGGMLEVAGLDWLHVAASNATLRATRGLEVVMVLDNTGSMRGGDKDGELRAAARSLADVLFDGAASKPHLWVGVVPYTATVNIGAEYADWLADPALDPTLPPASMSDFAPTTWKGCVLARTGGGDRTDATPAEAPFDPFFWPSMDDPEAEFSGYSNDGDGSTGGPPMNIWPDAGGHVDERNEARNDGYGPNLGCGPAILPLTPHYDRVAAKIDEMAPWHRGGTMANMGLVWGWRVLSPEWRGLWRDASGAAMTTLPLDHDEPYMSKVIVLMTDGDNQWYKEDYTAYRYPDDDLLGGVGVDDRMLEACDLLKADGIVVYTITFGGGVNDATAELYEDCASAPDQDVYFPGRKYFDAPTGEDLQAAFGAIGGQLTELRLTQ